MTRRLHSWPDFRAVIYYFVVWCFFLVNEFHGENEVNTSAVEYEIDYLRQLPKSSSVYMTIILHQIEKIDEINQELQIQITYSLSWNVRRMRSNFYQVENDTVFLTLSKDRSAIPRPDIYIDNEKQRHIIYSISSNLPDQIRLNHNGTVCYSVRVSTTLHCPMDFKFYPFAKIICRIRLSANDLALQWAREEPLLLADNVMQPSLFELEDYHFENHTSGVSTFYRPLSTITMDLIFLRKYHFYVWKFYIPVVIVLLISWLPFWLGRVLVLRIYLCLCTVLFLSMYYLSKPNELRISYLTALDAWRSTNFAFVLLAALESIFITYMIKTNRTCVKRIHPDENEKFKMLQCKYCPLKKKYLEVDNEKTDLDLEIMKLKANFKIQFVNVSKEVEIIDNVAKLFFPSAYLIFLFFYCFKCFANLY